MCLSPEVTEETLFLFGSGEWESGCDTSSPLDKPGGQESEANNALSGELADYTRPDVSHVSTEYTTTS